MSDEESKAEEIIRQIAKSIALKEYAVHSNLPSSRDLAEQYGVSKSTIRFALKELASMLLISLNNKQLAIVNDWNYWKIEALPYVINTLTQNKTALKGIVKLGIQFWRSTYLTFIPSFKGKKINKNEVQRIEKLAWENRDNPAIFLNHVGEIIRYILVSNSMQSFLWIFNDLSSTYIKMDNHLFLLSSAIIENWDMNKKIFEHIADGDSDEAVKWAIQYFDGVEYFILSKLELL